VKRLIYCPKAYIFVRSSNLNRVYDVSSDVVSGSVTSNINDVSKATFQLRNRYRKWIRSPNDENLQIFLPMDMVTIWLQRVSGKPIQVFTGYLDEVPYYQAYPGNAVFSATCTLKKLAFTWFDPGLQFFTTWINSVGGWKFNPTTGEAINPTAMTQNEQINNIAKDTGQAGPAGTTAASINDSGFDALLGRFLVEVAGWSTEDVLIAALPSDLPKLAAQLYTKIEGDTEQDLKNLAAFLAAAMGVSGWQNPSTSTPTTTAGGPAQTATMTNLIQTITPRAKSAGIPLEVLLLESFLTTGFDTSYSQDSNSGQAQWGYGLYALQPTPIIGSAVPGLANSPAASLGSTIDGKTSTQLLDVATSTDVFCKLLNAHQGAWSTSARKGDVGAMVTWIEKALGRSMPKNVNLTSAFNQVKQIAGTSVVVTPPTGTPATTVKTAQISFTDANVQNALTATEKKTITDKYKGASPWLATYILAAKGVDKGLQVVEPSSKPNTIDFSGSSASLIAFFNSLKGKSEIDEVTLRINGGQTQDMKKGVASSLKGNVTLRTGSTITITQSTKPVSTQTTTVGGDPTSTTSTTGGGGGALINSGQALAAFSANAAYAANFSFPTNVIESMSLVGNKALMNDISCLDGVKQFCKASLRAFRSLPDGRFLAFYPDYFGAYRQPYWDIKNIELTNFGIQLNDDSLATHVYVIGDTFAADGAITYQDEVSSRGVATITQAFMLNSFIETYTAPNTKATTLTQPRIGRLADAHAFLQHYGARPHKEEQPLIRNTFYEFLMAWQKFMELWAMQFATEVSFTFQPEVMAGGLISFSDHDVQMFCQSVTHTWDYSEGFETQAVMTAPSLTKTQKDSQSKPGFALGGNINTVGSD
jgi:hypothetical protein